MSISAIFISERRRPALRRFLQSPALRRFLQFVILIYNLPISIYYALQLRTPLSLLVCALLTAANIAMFRMGAAIEAGRSQLMLYYKLLAIGLTLVGLFGLLQRYCHCA